MLVIAGPTEGQVANAFSYARAILLSSQVRAIKKENMKKVRKRERSNLSTKQSQLHSDVFENDNFNSILRLRRFRAPITR